MPVTESAKKKLRVDKRRKKVNKKVLGKMRSAIKKASEAPTKEKIDNAYRMIDRAAKKGVIKKNKAGRLKAKLVRETKKKLDESPFKRE